MKNKYFLVNLSLLQSDIDAEFKKLANNLSDSDHKTLIMAGAELFKMRVIYAIEKRCIEFPSEKNVSATGDGGAA